ncbi:Hint domain-containing protein [Maliponia aquimaris]|uniref:Hedgehog/Intein (Hint) domain-containing protein n=1 Tax=Maliponia aquimaris TaxID=1673631 RepID=A0A238JQ79_9RHOB|nr:Hint domain-containing protein [Maliponia aquimaris]SMX32838.1 hypothetical protein MAA8898_00341 [Maliponia aquimaris]
MGTGFRGTFVISWAQTQIDGQRDAPLPALQVGASWSWEGQPVRVDGPSTVLLLGDPDGQDDIRSRAARMVRRLVGLPPAPAARAGEDAPDSMQRGDFGFVVTDGRRGYSVTVIPAGHRAPPLLMFVDEVPPAGTDLWVVHHARALAATSAGPEAAGSVICFTPGTHILTPTGAIPVEQLREGDLVQTKDNGAQPVCWTGSRRMSGARLFTSPALRPIRLRAGAFGIGHPERDLLVSPDHRMLIKGRAAQALFNTPEVLVAARDLINGDSVVQDLRVPEVTYIHLLLPRHEVLFAEGLETESFHPANTALTSLTDDDRARLVQVLPGALADPQGYGDYARRNLSRSEAAILMHDAA